MNEELFWELQRILSAEFSKYVLSHPEMDEQIPDGAQIVFNITNNPEFNEWAMRIARLQQQPNQPIVIVTIKELMPISPSRLINPELKLVSSI
jgi:hypothetical protein